MNIESLKTILFATLIFTLISSFGIEESFAEAPTVTITSPLDGYSGYVKADFVLTATVSDEDSDLEDTLQWYGDDELYSVEGNELLYDFDDAGTHTIRVVATDSEGLIGSDEITISISDEPFHTFTVIGDTATISVDTEIFGFEDAQFAMYQGCSLLNPIILSDPSADPTWSFSPLSADMMYRYWVDVNYDISDDTLSADDCFAPPAGSLPPVNNPNFVYSATADSVTVQLLNPEALGAYYYLYSGDGTTEISHLRLDKTTHTFTGLESNTQYLVYTEVLELDRYPIEFDGHRITTELTQNSEPPTDDSPQDIICDDDLIEGGTYQSISVETDTSCFIRNVTVLDDIKADDTTGFAILDSNVGGNLIIKNSDDIDGLYIKNVEIGNNLVLKNLNQSSDTDIDTVSVGNKFFVTNNIFSDNFIIDDGQFDGNVIISDNELIGTAKIGINDGIFSKNLIVRENRGDNGYLQLDVGLVMGNIQIVENHVFFLQLQSSTIQGKIVLRDNTVIDEFNIQRNTSDEKIVIKSNVAGLLVFDENTSLLNRLIDNEMTTFFCEDITPEPIMKRNIVDGKKVNTC